MTESTWFKKLFYQWKLFCRSARHYFYKNSHTNLVNTIRCLENESEDRIHKYLTAFDIERREYQAEIERLTAELEKEKANSRRTDATSILGGIPVIVCKYLPPNGLYVSSEYAEKLKAQTKGLPEAIEKVLRGNHIPPKEEEC